MNSHTTSEFRDALQQLSAEVRRQAREAYEQFKSDPFSPGLNFDDVNTNEAYLVCPDYPWRSRSRYPRPR